MNTTTIGLRSSEQEWMGSIPDGWEMAPIKRLFQIQLGKMLQKDSCSGSESLVPYMKAVNVMWGRVDNEDLPQMWANSFELQQYGVKDGDLLVCEGGEVGRAAILSNAKTPCIIQNALHRLRPKEDGANARFLMYVFQAISNSGWLEVLCNKATIPHLTREKIAALIIPAPEKPEQESIASFLDEKTSAIDALIADKERLIELLQEKRSALITHAVTKGLDPNAPMKDSGVEWLGEIPEHWETCRLKFLVRMVGGGTPSKENSEFWQGNIPWVSPKDMKSPRITDTEDHISEEALVSSATSLVEAGNVLLVVRSGILRNTVPVAINECSVSLNQDMKALIVRGTINSEYLFFLIKGLEPSILALCTKAMATVESIEVEDLRTLEIPLPPLKEQSRCAPLLNQETEQISSVIRDLSDSVYLLKEYRSALITAAVTGQIDVREATA